MLVRWTARGTHRGELMGLRRTNRSATVTGISVQRFRDGKIVEDWTQWDALSMFQQFGVAPPAIGSRLPSPDAGAPAGPRW